MQIALFVAPLLIFVSYLFGKPMDLEFSQPEVFAVATSTYILFQISGDGETNWIEGVQLLSVYVILGILFFICRKLSRTSSGNRPRTIVLRKGSIFGNPVNFPSDGPWLRVTCSAN